MSGIGRRLMDNKKDECKDILTGALRKKPDEGRMKGLAFALDPDGYWVELLKGGPKGRNTLAQTMLRVKEMVLWIAGGLALFLNVSLCFYQIWM